MYTAEAIRDLMMEQGRLPGVQQQTYYSGTKIPVGSNVPMNAKLPFRTPTGYRRSIDEMMGKKQPPVFFQRPGQKYMMPPKRPPGHHTQGGGFTDFLM